MKQDIRPPWADSAHQRPVLPLWSSNGPSEARITPLEKPQRPVLPPWSSLGLSEVWSMSKVQWDVYGWFYCKEMITRLFCIFFIIFKNVEQRAISCLFTEGSISSTHKDSHILQFARTNQFRITFRLSSASFDVDNFGFEDLLIWAISCLQVALLQRDDTLIIISFQKSKIFFF